jgi:hypothetical protein
VAEPAAPQAGVPVAMRPVVEAIIAITDEFCTAHLDQEYAQLCRRLTAKLARKRPSPLARGDRLIWAAGVVHVIGRVNFLSDPNQRPHLPVGEMAGLLGVKQQTMGNKGRLIMNALRISVLDPEWSRQEMIDKNPLTWLVELNGLLLDVRMLPVQIQINAARRGLIPYVPAIAGGQDPTDAS